MSQTETAELTPDALDATERRLQAELERRKRENKLAYFEAYPKQQEFFSAGATHRERLCLFGNRIGKTTAGAFEMAVHLTGRYPDDWPGKRFDKPIRAWAAGVTGETTRDILQEKLIGPPLRDSEWGTGMVPKDALGPTSRAQGITGAIDSVSVKHISGGYFNLQFKSYERGREKWQGVALEVLFFDEEPPIDVHLEGLTRTNETGGIAYIMATPLLGMSDVVKRFLVGD